MIIPFLNKIKHHACMHHAATPCMIQNHVRNPSVFLDKFELDFSVK